MRIPLTSESLNYGLEVEENWKRAERILKNLEASWLRSLTRRSVLKVLSQDEIRIINTTISDIKKDIQNRERSIVLIILNSSRLQNLNVLILKATLKMILTKTNNEVE